MKAAPTWETLHTQHFFFSSQIKQHILLPKVPTRVGMFGEVFHSDM